MEVLVDLLEVLDVIDLLLYPASGHVVNCSPSLFLRNSWKIIWRWDEVGVFPSKNDLPKEKDSGLFSANSSFIMLKKVILPLSGLCFV